MKSLVIALILISTFVISGCAPAEEAREEVLEEMKITSACLTMLTVDIDPTYTYYDSTKGELSVKINRGHRDEEMIGFKLTIESDRGNSKEITVREVMGPEEERTFIFTDEVKDLGWFPDSISVKPIVKISGKEIECETGHSSRLY